MDKTETVRIMMQYQKVPKGKLRTDNILWSTVVFLEAVENYRAGEVVIALNKNANSSEKWFYIKSPTNSPE